MLQLFILGIAILLIFVKKWYDFSIYLILTITIYKCSKLVLIFSFDAYSFFYYVAIFQTVPLCIGLDKIIVLKKYYKYYSNHQGYT